MTPPWSPTDVDAVSAWGESGCQWLTAPGVAVPVELVQQVTGVVRYLDACGATLAEISTAAGLGLLSERAAMIGLMPSGSTSCGGASRLVECADGWLAVSLARDDDLEAIPAWLGSEAASSRSGVDHWALVESTARHREVRGLVDQARLLEIPCAEVGERSSVEPPVLVDTLGDARPLPLSGAVVMNLASLWAGPLCADVLARLGARVITIEDERRFDGARSTARFFDALHGRSESVALALSTDAGREQLRQLLVGADVVIEGSRPRALRQMKIDARRMVEIGPQIWVSITGHGRTEPWAGRVGFGDDCAAAGGLVGWVADRPRFIADAVADPLAGLVAAATVAQRAAAGCRVLVDVALSRCAAMATAHPARRNVRAAPTPLRPVARSDPGSPMRLGGDTHRVLSEFAVDS